MNTLNFSQKRISNLVMADVRIFLYLPNPRVAKATITARINNVDVEVIGAALCELANWLGDFDARPLTDADRQSATFKQTARTGFSGELHKTPEFLRAHPYGTAPAAFNGDGGTGIFESNTIMRVVARLGNMRVPLYGRDDFTASRIDSFLDTALLFTRDSEIYLLAIGNRAVNAEIQRSMVDASIKYPGGLERALSTSNYICGDELTIADICLVCEMSLFARERAAFLVLGEADLSSTREDIEQQFPACIKHYNQLHELDPVRTDLGAYVAKIESNIARRT
jgi:glutathione S-transferase